MSYKDQGNVEYKKGNWLKAAALYTKGIKEDPENAVLSQVHKPCAIACAVLASINSGTCS